MLPWAAFLCRIASSPLRSQLPLSSMSKMAQRNYSSDVGDDVLFSTNNNVGIITLNRPKALNALNLSMIRKIYPKLKEWQDQVKMVIIEGAGEKAFCAGGDIRAITDSKGSPSQGDFFREEYQLNHLTSTCRVPYIALINGITMGGGVGLSVHGRFRVCNERTVFAMPETGIGLVPDVGGGHFLPRLSGQLGMFLALTGHRLKGIDCLHAGVATHACPNDQFEKLKEDLIAVEDVEKVGEVLDSYTKKFGENRFSISEKMQLIDRCFARGSIEEILGALDNSGDPWAEKLAVNMRKMSPTSMKVTFNQIRRGKHIPLSEVLKMEYRLVRRCCEDSDFYEGVRAVLVDRDNDPKWNPCDLEGVTDKMVERYFSKLPDDEELKL